MLRGGDTLDTKYFNPYTDFGFKKLFGEEASKELLVDFLNQLLPAHHQIASLQFKNPESLNDTAKERTAIFEIYCKTDTGSKFIVEMQKAKANYFKDRSLFCSTFPVREQAEKEGWDFQLLPIYFIAILDFRYDEKDEERKFRRDVCLKDLDAEVFFDRLHFKFLQMPLFNKQPHELETHFDKWVYFLKNLDSFDHVPDILNEPIFIKGFEVAEISHLRPEHYENYLKSLLNYWEIKNVQDTAFNEGRLAGIAAVKAEGKIEAAKALKQQGVAMDIIAATTGLTVQEIQKL